MQRLRGTEPGWPSVLLWVAASGASAVSATGLPPARTATVTVTLSAACATLEPAYSGKSEPGLERR